MIKKIIFILVILFYIGIIYFNNKTEVETQNNTVHTCAQVLCKPDNLSIICDSNTSKYKVVNFC